MTDEDLENNENLFTVDNLVCKNCENRLGSIETICAPIIKSIAQPEDEIEKIEIEQNLEIRLLFLSILFRLGNAEKFDYNLNNALKLRIRNILDKVLDTDPKVVEQNLVKFRGEIISIPMAIFYSPLSEENSSGNNIYCHNETSIPAITIMNEFVLIVYNSKTQTSFDFGTVYSVDKPMVNTILNFKEDSFSIGYVDRTDINKSLNNNLVKAMYQNISSMYRQVSIEHKRIDPAAEEVKAFMDELIFDDTPEADKYTPGNISRVMHKHLVP